MMGEVSAIIIYCIWIMFFYFQNLKRIEKLECEKIELETRLSELEKTVYIVPKV